MVQGLGVGAIGPVTIALISNMFPLEKRGSAMGIYAAIHLLSNVIGPILGGMIAQAFSWQWAFYMVIPVGLLSIILILPLQTEPIQATPNSLRKFLSKTPYVVIRRMSCLFYYAILLRKIFLFLQKKITIYNQTNMYYYIPVVSNTEYKLYRIARGDCSGKPNGNAQRRA